MTVKESVASKKSNVEAETSVKKSKPAAKPKQPQESQKQPQKKTAPVENTPVVNTTNNTELNTPSSPALTTKKSKKLWNDIGITAGSSIIDIKPILLESYILVACLNKVYIYNIKTGLKKNQIVLDGFITSMCLAGETLLVSSSGILYQYSLDITNKKPNKNTLEQPTPTMREPITLDNDIIVYMATNPVNPNHLYFATPSQVFFVDISNNNNDDSSNKNSKNDEEKENKKNIVGKMMVDVKIKYILTMSGTRGIYIHNNGIHMAVYSNSEFLIIINLKSGKQNRFSTKEKITCMAFHPNEDLLSYGDNSGRVSNIILKANNDIIPAGYQHWHPAPVISLIYSPDGNLMFSGGFEATLAVWTTSTQRRSFLPRIGGSIQHIDINPSTSVAAVTLHNNVIKLVALSDLSVTTVIRGIRKQNSTFTADPYSQTLASYGGDGSIQFFNPRKNQVTGELIVVPPSNTPISTAKSLNQVSDSITNNPFELPTSRVTHVAFSHDSTMATFEQQTESQLSDSEKFVRDRILKFWNLDSDQQYQCAFAVTCPHSTPILSLEFHPRLPYLITGAAEDFKLWQRKEDRWSCVFTGGYKEMPVNAVTFSKDGTVFAASAGHNITLWKLKDFQFITNITNTTTYSPIKDIQFIHNDEKLLVTYVDFGLSIWDLKSLTPILNISERLDSVAISPDGDYFAISGFLNQPSNYYFAVFNDQLQCVSMETFQFPAKGLVFLRESNALSIYYTPFPHCLCGVSTAAPMLARRIDPTNNSKKNNKNNNNKNNKNNITNPTKLPVQVKQHFKNTKKEQKKNQTENWEQKAKILVEKEAVTQTQQGVQIVGSVPNQLFNVASHIIPGVQSIYQSFMDSMLTSKTSTQSSNESSSSSNTNAKPQQQQQQQQSQQNQPPKNYKLDLSSLNSLQFYFNNKSSTTTTPSAETTTTTTPQPSSTPKVNKHYKSTAPDTTSTPAQEKTETTPAPAKNNKNYKPPTTTPASTSAKTEATPAPTSTPKVNKHYKSTAPAKPETVVENKRKRDEEDDKEAEVEETKNKEKIETQAKKKQIVEKSNIPVAKKSATTTATKSTIAKSTATTTPATTETKSKIPSTTKKSTVTAPTKSSESKSKIPTSSKK